MQAHRKRPNPSSGSDGPSDGNKRRAMGSSGYSSGATVGNPTKQGSFIPLIECIDDQYRVCEDAVNFLKGIPGPLAVVSIVGKYRTGKSWLLNTVLLNCPAGEGFSVGDTTKACTKGLLLAKKVLKIKQKDNSILRVVVMDTEGIGSLCANSNHDSRVFALAMLLSSYMLYNSVGPIDEAALENLSLVTNLTKEIKLNRANESSNSASEYAIRNDTEMRQYLPSLLWVLRDFSLKMVDEVTGATVNADQYLEQCLRERMAGKFVGQGTSGSKNGLVLIEDSPEKEYKESKAAQEEKDESKYQKEESKDVGDLGGGAVTLDAIDSVSTFKGDECPGANDMERHKNKIRRTLRTYFPDRTCVTLPRPSASETVDMNDLGKLRPQFKDGIKRLQGSIVSAIKPKLIGGKPISGPIFAKLCQKISTAINNNAVPVVRDVWDMLSKDRCIEAYHEGMAIWDNEEKLIKEGLENGTKVLSTGALSSKVASLVQQIKREYEGRAVGEHSSEYFGKLMHSLEDKQKALLATHRREIQSYLQKKVVTKLNSVIASGANFKTINEAYGIECTQFVRAAVESLKPATSSASASSTTSSAASASASSVLGSAFGAGSSGVSPAAMAAEETKARNDFILALHDWYVDMSTAQNTNLHAKIESIEAEIEAKHGSQVKELAAKTKAELDATKAELEELRGQLTAKQTELDEIQAAKATLHETLSKERTENAESKTQLETQMDQTRVRLLLLEQEQKEERQESLKAAQLAQQQSTEYQEKIAELQGETKRLTDEADKMHATTIELEELRVRTVDLESEKATLQQDNDKLTAELSSIEEDFEQQLNKLKQDSSEGMAELHSIQKNKQEALALQLSQLKQSTDTEITKLTREKDQLALKYKNEISQAKESQQELQRTVEEVKEEKSRTKEQLVFVQQQLQETKKVHDTSIDKMRDKHYDEMKQLRDQMTKELREFNEKEMTLGTRCSGLEHKLELSEQKLNEAQKKLGAEVAARAQDKHFIIDHPRLKEKLSRVEMQLRTSNDAHAATKQMLRTQTDRVNTLERQMKDRERRSDLANTSAQFMLARQRLLEDDGNTLSGNNLGSSSSTDDINSTVENGSPNAGF